MLHVSIKPETIFEVAGFPVTNSLLTSVSLLIIFLFLGLYYSKNQHSGSKVIFFIRLMLTKLHGSFAPILGKFTDQAFPFVASFFLFILFSNWIGLLPGVGSIVLKPDASVIEHVAEEEVVHIDEVVSDNIVLDDHGEPIKIADSHDEGTAAAVTQEEASHAEEDEHHEPAAIPILRGATADINTTLGLAIISFILIQYFGFQALGLSYLSKFISIADPMKLFIGILETISEFSKIVSFSFRLFGNIFAGEVLLAVIAFLIPVLASFPFLILEIFVGLIQALVFAMLTAVFISTAVESHEGH